MQRAIALEDHIQAWICVHIPSVGGIPRDN